MIDGGTDRQFDIGADSLTEQIRETHDRVLEIAPDISRMACALYDPQDDLLKTFLNSTREGVALRGYQYRLADSPSLSELARERRPRLLTDLPHQLDPSSAHSAYVLDEGYVSSFTVPMVHRHEFLGFLFYDSRLPDAFPPAVVRELLLHSSLLTMAVAHEMVAISSVVGTIQIARDFTELRDHETGAHLDRMSRYARVIARDTATHFGFDDETVEHIQLFAPMHDIGKIGIPDHILLKRGTLSPAEWDVMKTHTTRGATMVDSILRDLDLVDVPNRQMLRNIVEFHHEKLDGSGYPRGLVGDAVPVEARIIAVADVFDALTSARPYKQAWSFEEGVAELSYQVSTGKLDEVCVAALTSAIDEIAEIRGTFPDNRGEMN
jgi:HD-GYP domain-containing protein (c-di-GMP phosphodiesterase class II)